MEFSAELDEGPPRTLQVSGTIDITTVEQFAEHLDSAGRGGVRPLVVDLTAVHVLASPGVRALFTARDRHDTHDTPLTIVVVPGGVAAQILDLVGLSHAGPDR